MAGGYLRALWLPLPPKTDIPYPDLLPLALHSSLPIQTLSMHVKPNETGKLGKQAHT